jgi:hypothetical protein
MKEPIIITIDVALLIAGVINFDAIIGIPFMDLAGGPAGSHCTVCAVALKNMEVDEDAAS